MTPKASRFPWLCPGNAGPTSVVTADSPDFSCQISCGESGAGRSTINRESEGEVRSRCRAPWSGIVAGSKPSQRGLRSMASATSAPALFDGVQVVHSAEREDHALSCGMHRRMSRAGPGKPVLLDQRIKNQSAVDAAQHSTVCRVIRSRFRDHESFAFLASHLPTSCMDGIVARARM